ncbi:MAG: hypothetical protein VKK04_09040 [Synechococcales bacterium]|nr:hypothetical protein [Synechococcales bacterium]
MTLPLHFAIAGQRQPIALFKPHFPGYLVFRFHLRNSPEGSAFRMAEVLAVPALSSPIQDPPL